MTENPFLFVAKIFARTLESGRQSEQLGQQHYIRATEDESFRQLRRSLLQTVSEVLDEKVLEEEQSA